MAVVFALIVKLLFMVTGVDFLTGDFGNILWTILYYVIYINLVLMIFNLIPVPPLDGFSIISEIFNIKHTNLYYTIYNNGFFILMALILFDITDLILTPGVEFFMTLLNRLIFM